MTSDLEITAVPTRRPGRARRTLRGPSVVAATIVLTVIVLAAVFAPWVAPADPDQGVLFDSLQGPSADHLLGTDQLGRDILSRLIFGARTALIAAVIAVVVGVVIGVPLGMVLGYRGGRADRWIMRAVDALTALPALVIAIALIAVLGPGLAPSMVAVGIVYAMLLLRLMRGEVLAAREERYVEAARTGGAAPVRLLAVHIWPNAVPALLVQVTLLFAGAILVEAGLSFLGLGVQPPTASWGSMLTAAQEVIRRSWYQAIPPGVAILVTVLCFNVVGDALRDSFARDAVAPPLRASRVAAGTRSDQAPAPDSERPMALSIRGLQVEFPGSDGRTATVVDRVDLDVGAGEIVALVGESGSGKTMTALSVIGLVPGTGRVRADRLTIDGVDVVAQPPAVVQALRGRRIGMVFQEPLASLNPTLTVGTQLTEPLRIHLGMSRAEARARAVELLEMVHVTNPEGRLGAYAHELSGGIAQRVMIAMAISCQPSLLIADEPTTALDVTVQARILDLLDELRHELDMSVLLITHDLGVVATIADRVAVMLDGKVVEEGDVTTIIEHPRHTYTQTLLDAVANRGADTDAVVVPIRRGVVA